MGFIKGKLLLDTLMYIVYCAVFYTVWHISGRFEIVLILMICRIYIAIENVLHLLEKQNEKEILR